MDAALRWLREHSGWLLVLDNADSPEAAAAVEELLGQLQEGHVLVTSRLADWSGGIAALELDVLCEDDSIALLLERTAGRRREERTDEGDARALAHELGGLALALEQAGAFIGKLRVSLGDYLRRWRERERKVREWHDERLMKYPRSVAVTWDTSVSQLQPPALALLRLLCWFAPEPIPRALMETGVTRQVLAEGVQRLLPSAAGPGPPPTEVEDALAALAGFSLLKWPPPRAGRHVNGCRQLSAKGGSTGRCSFSTTTCQAVPRRATCDPGRNGNPHGLTWPR